MVYRWSPKPSLGVRFPLGLLMQEEKVQYSSRFVELTRGHFIKTMAEGHPIHNWFPRHVEQVEKWAKKILEYYPEADTEIVLLSVWLHDIGQANKEDHPIHEVISEKEARKFLKTIGLEEEKIEKVAHSVRTHRAKEGFKPQSTEAKILAGADSASHLTDIVYVYMLTDGTPKKEVLEKLDRDLRDVQVLPEPLKDELIPLGVAWRNLINVFPER